MGSSFQKWCCGLGQGTVWPVQASKAPRRAKKRPEVLSEQSPKCRESKCVAPWPLIEQIMKKRRLLVVSQQSSGLLADMSTAAAYMSTKKIAKAEKQVNSKHASSESADYIPNIETKVKQPGPG